MGNSPQNKSTLARILNNQYEGLTHDSKVILEVRLEDYHTLAKVISKSTSFIYKLSMNPLLKEELLRDIRTIRSVLEKSEKEVVK